MQYELEISLNLPRSRVIELFDSTENLKHWQQGLVSFEPLSGTPGQEGAKSKLRYQMGKKEIEMVETITQRNLPDEFSGTYEAKGVWNEVRNFFHEDGPNKTRWVTHHDFRMSGFMKVFAFLMPGAFKKQSFKYMEDFKAFAEKAGHGH